MGGGGGKTEARTYTSNIPDWASGAHRRSIEEAEQLAYDPRYGYDATQYYGGPRVAAFSPEEMRGFDVRNQLFDAGDPYAAFSSDQMASAAGIPGQIGEVSSTYGPASFDFGTFGTEQANRYMSPYMQNVVELEKGAAQEEYARQQNISDAERVASGARGGYREAVEQALGGQLQAETIAGIQARGSQSAFENAQAQYERDRGAAIEAARMGDASSLAAAKMRMEASEANRSALFKKAQVHQDMAKVSAGLGDTAQAREYTRLKEMERAGVTQKEREQQLMDMAYEDFMRRANWPRQQINWLQGVLTGVPQGMEQTEYGQTPGLASQLAGLGALYKAMNPQ